MARITEDPMTTSRDLDVARRLLDALTTDVRTLSAAVADLEILVPCADWTPAQAKRYDELIEQVGTITNRYRLDISPWGWFRRAHGFAEWRQKQETE